MSLHSFDPAMASRVGVNAAVIYQNILFWTRKNLANGKHIHGEKVWTYNSVKALNELFEYLTPDQIRRALQRLLDAGLIFEGNFNPVAYDRTKWYGVPCQIHLAKTTNGSGENPKPIPDSKPDSKPDKIDAIASVPSSQDQSPKVSTREIADILEAWASPSAVASFLAYRRKRKGGAMTLTAAKRQAAQLKAIFQSNGDTDDALGMAEERGWQSVQADWYFNAKGKTNGTRPQKPSFTATLHAALDAAPVGASLIDRSKRDPFAVNT